jgi:tRNA-dependent cyclodipeptide synthase
MGVSLSNLTFNREFVTALAAHVGRHAVSHSTVIVFDDCEIVNIHVFHGLSRDAARARSTERATASMRMFERIMPPDSTTIDTQSHYLGIAKQAEPTYAQLKRAYDHAGIFRDDVQAQVRINLTTKMERLGKEEIEKNLETLSEYILLELAWFYEYFKQDSATIEIYPGTELFTKRKLIRGMYEPQTGLPPLANEPEYINLYENNLP